LSDLHAEESPGRSADRLLRETVLQGGRWLWLLGASSLVLAGAEIALPALLGRAVDAALGTGTGSPAPWVLGVGALTVLMVAADAADDLASGSATAASTASLRRRLLRHVLALGARAEHRFPAGDLATRLGGNAADVGKLSPRLVQSLGGTLAAVGGLVALAVINVWLCVAMLAVIPPLILLLRVLTSEATDAGSDYLQTQGELSGRLVDALSGARTIAAAGTEDREVARVLGPLPELHRRGVRMWEVQARMVAQQSLFVPLLEVAVLAVGGLLLTRGSITPGGLLAAAQYVALASSLDSATGVLAQVAHSRAAARRIGDVLGVVPMTYGTEEPPKAAAASATAAAPELPEVPQRPGRLELRHVSVRIGDRQVLSDVDVVIPGGALVAVVGPSGAGKTVLASLAGRLVDPDEGEVLLDGVPLSRLSRHALRTAVAYGFERPALFGETVAEAIAFGPGEPNPGKVVVAARAAQAHGFIERLPRGYRTPLIDAPMSGGERQRVGLARAFAHAQRVLVLDDVVASLDTMTERSIVSVLTGALAGRTRILVAHRASTAARADMVVWLEAGHVRATGTHADLWREPAYRALFGAGPAGLPGPAATAETAGTAEEER
jgi:ATP-binding cassette subfamily B protein